MKLTKTSRSLVGKHLRVLKAFPGFKNGDIVEVRSVWRNNVRVWKHNGMRIVSLYVHVSRFELAESPNVAPVKMPTGDIWIRGRVFIGPSGRVLIGGSNLAQALSPFDHTLVTVTIKKGL